MKLPKWVAHIDDETSLDHGYIVTLANGCTFKDEPDCGVRGFDTMAELKQAVKRDNIIISAAGKSPAADQFN
jgi:hypothetical protein